MCGPRHCHYFFALRQRRHLNELKINFALVALASLRMEMMMDNNDATTGSPTCNADDDKSSTPPSRVPTEVNETPIGENSNSDSVSNWNWASASLNWFVCDLRSDESRTTSFQCLRKSPEMCRREKRNSFCFNICLNISKMPLKRQTSFHEPTSV